MRRERILCPTDFSDNARLALEAAVDLARSDGAKLKLVHVYHVPPSGYHELSGLFLPETIESLKADAVQGLAAWKAEAEKLGARDVTAVAIQGSAWDEIVRLAEEEKSDLIVLGTQGRTGLERVILGSVAERVIRHAPCSVLVVR